MKKCSTCGCVELTKAENLELAQIELHAPISARTMSKRFGITPAQALKRLTRWHSRGFLRVEILEARDRTNDIYLAAIEPPKIAT